MAETTAEQGIDQGAEESYQVVSGTLEVCLGKNWRKLSAGDRATVPPGMPHTVRNLGAEPVRLINVHRPALGFERFFSQPLGKPSVAQRDRAGIPPPPLCGSARCPLLEVGNRIGQIRDGSQAASGGKRFQGTPAGWLENPYQ